MNDFFAINNIEDYGDEDQNEIMQIINEADDPVIPKKSLEDLMEETQNWHNLLEQAKFEVQVLSALLNDAETELEQRLGFEVDDEDPQE